MLYFYIPEPIESNLTVSGYWEWLKRSLPLPQSLGVYHWTLLTYLYLKENGTSCKLVNEIPKQGTLITHIDLIPRSLRPSQQLKIVALTVDRDWRNYPYAHFYVVHNQRQLSFTPRSIFISPWPQNDLIPRDPKREDRFENIAFMGIPKQLAKELESFAFQSSLGKMGLRWIIPETSKWNDFSEIDAIIGVRSFNDPNHYDNKPALKLINAWLAQVPSIFGKESAYRNMGQPGKDYAEVSSTEEVLRLLSEWKSNPEKRRRMVEAGLGKSSSFTSEKILKDWQATVRKCTSPRISDHIRKLFERAIRIAQERGPYFIRRSLMNWIYRSKENGIWNTRVVVYTSAFGSDAKLREAKIFPGVDYVCFTDQPHLKSQMKIQTWKINRWPRSQGRWSKAFKILPHRYFKKYSYSLWIDPTHRLVVHPFYLIDRFLTDSDIALFKDKKKRLVADELERRIQKGTKSEEAMKTWIKPFESRDQALSSSTVILRKHDSPPLQKSMADWWVELYGHGKSEQLCLDYALKKQDIRSCLIPGHVDHNVYFDTQF